MNKRKEIPFEKYNFKRATYKKADLPNQMGNAEMGGLVSKSGLGFEKLYFADVWDTEESRMALPGPIFSNAEISPEKLGQADFENELTLKEGILTTKAKYQKQFAYHSEIFFSKTNPHLLCFRISAETANTEEWTLNLPITDFTISTIDKGLNGVASNRDLYSKISWPFSISNKFSIENEAVKIQIRQL
ncbi:MAG TPA: hypothetical protein VJ951_15085 [Bacteroidales bacterium]|nr:hypothetical protein [Bacteroidales bacterium]